MPSQESSQLQKPQDGKRRIRGRTVSESCELFRTMSTHTIVIESCDLQSDLKLQEYKDLIAYKNDIKYDPQYADDKLKITISKCATIFKLDETCELTHLCDLFDMDSVDWSESPGLPWCERGFKTKEDIRNNPEAIQEVRRFWHYVKLSYFENNEQMTFPYCLVYSNPGNKKLPAVWEYPATINFGEALFTTNLVKSYTKLGESGVMAYAYKNNCEGSKRLYHRLHQENRYFVKLEFNDDSVAPWLIHYAFLIVLQNINYSRFEGNGVPDARFMFHMFDTIEEYFISTRIKLANGTCLYKQNGLAKGSQFSLLIGSIISAIIVEYLSICIDRAYAEDLVVFGNESLARVKSYWDLNVCRDIIKKDFGITLNLSKSQISKNLKQIRFLGFKRIWM